MAWKGWMDEGGDDVKSKQDPEYIPPSPKSIKCMLDSTFRLSELPPTTIDQDVFLDFNRQSFPLYPNAELIEIFQWIKSMRM